MLYPRALSLFAILTASFTTAEAQNCPRQIEVGGNPGNISRWEVVSASPLTIRERQKFSKDDPFHAEQTYTGPTLRHQADFYKDEVSNCGRGVPGWCQSSSVSNQREVAQFLACHLALSGSRKDSSRLTPNSNSTQGDRNSPSATTGGMGQAPTEYSAGVDEVTPQVPGCPRYVSKLNIEWRRKPGANPQLNVWEVRNVSNRFTFRVTYRADGANTDLPTLNPGDTAEAWGLKNEPPFVVRNFYDMKVWERSNSQEKSLQCSLAIRPR